MLKIKRVYDPVDISDGWRVLTDRLWPRGLTKENAHVDGWYRELGPSDDLRKWFSHDPEKWEEFRRKYREELQVLEKKIMLKQIAEMAEKADVTILYASRETRYNNAVVLEGVIREMVPKRVREAAPVRAQ